MLDSPIELLKNHFRQRSLVRKCCHHLELGASLIDPDNHIDEQIVANRHTSGIAHLVIAQHCLANSGLTLSDEEYRQYHDTLTSLIFSVRASNYSKDACQLAVSTLVKRQLANGRLTYESRWF